MKIKEILEDGDTKEKLLAAILLRLNDLIKLLEEAVPGCQGLKEDDE